ncbi:hypothetical protein ACC722_38255, partial [Rhizobium ruizarguesonis]
SIGTIMPLAKPDERAGLLSAFWSGLMRMTGTKTDGAAVDIWFRQTLGLVKQDGRWLVAHQHA